MSAREFPLGRIAPPDDVHIRRHPVTLRTQLSIVPVPVVLGINWYRRFFEPVRLADRSYWLGVDENGRVLVDLGPIDGGHAIASKPSSLTDYPSWQRFYNQPDGSCTGFSASRAMTWLNRRRYAAHWLYEQAQLRDDWPETPPEEGSSVRAAFDVLRDVGHRRIYAGKTYPPMREDGILENQWATTVADVLSVLQSPRFERRGAIPLYQTWYPWPREVWLPLELLDRLLNEDGEATMMTDYT